MAFVPVPIERIPPCQCGCPNGNDVRGWLAIIAQRGKTGLDDETAYRTAWETLARGNPFPATMGRICPHPCEASCSRGDREGPVAIQALERFLGDRALERGWPLRTNPEPGAHESVAAIGGGPAGLSFAYQMARRGYGVTLYERSNRLGGMLVHGIPEFRLPEKTLEAEIRRIVDLGIDVRLQAAIGRDITVDGLRERHAAVFVAIGAQKGLGLGLPGEDGPGVWPGTDFLAAINRGETPALGPNVVVVGGGNTAVDAARAARRLGAQVTVVYRRSREEMPAIRDEVDEAIEEGVELLQLATPTRIVREEGRPVAVEAQRMSLGEADASGRRRPIPIPGSALRIPASALVAAVSQEPDWTRLDDLRPEGVWVKGEADGEIASGVWAGGDVRSLGIAGLAIAQGRIAAEAVHARLRGIERAPSAKDGPRIGPEEVKPQFYADRPRVASPVADVRERLSDPDHEVVGTIDEPQFLAEVARCYSCGLCFGCRHCWTYCNASGFTKIAEPRPGRYYALTLDRCEGCGKCIDLCPCGYLSVNGPPAAPSA